MGYFADHAMHQSAQSASSRQSLWMPALRLNRPPTMSEASKAPEAPRYRSMKKARDPFRTPRLLTEQSFLRNPMPTGDQAR